MQKNKIIIFTDPGLDDALAISYALVHPQIEVCGIVASYGNHHVSQTYANLKKLLKLLQQDVPVFLGANKPLVKGYQPFYGLHGYDGFANLGANPEKTNSLRGWKSANKNKVASFLKNLDLSKITIVVTCPLTELAKHAENETLNEVKEILIMGGSLFYPGNAENLQEGNFFYDPEAVDVVLNKMSSKIILFPLNITHQLLVGKKQIMNLDRKSQSTKFLRKLLEFYINSYKSKGKVLLPPIGERSEWNFEKFSGAAIHDVVPLLYLLHKENFIIVNLPIKVVRDGEAAGSIYVDFKDGYHIRVASKFAGNNYWEWIVNILNEK